MEQKLIPTAANALSTSTQDPVGRDRKQNITQRAKQKHVVKKLFMHEFQNNTHVHFSRNIFICIDVVTLNWLQTWEEHVNQKVS